MPTLYDYPKPSVLGVSLRLVWRDTNLVSDADSAEYASIRARKTSCEITNEQWARPPRSNVRILG